MVHVLWIDKTAGLPIIIFIGPCARAGYPSGKVPVRRQREQATADIVHFEPCRIVFAEVSGNERQVLVLTGRDQAFE